MADIPLQGEIITNRNIEIVQTGVKTVTRVGGNNGGFAEVLTGALKAPGFMCFAKKTTSTTITQLPTNLGFIQTGADAGKSYGQIYAIYDPPTGDVQFIIETTASYPTVATTESYDIRYYIFRERASS